MGGPPNEIALREERSTRHPARWFPEAFGEFQQRQAQLDLGDLTKRLQEPCRIGLGKDFSQWVVAGLIAFPLTKERCDPYAKNGGKFFKPAASNAISSLLVFLNLLERYADLFSECRLRHTSRQAISPHTLSHEHVNGFDALCH